MKSTELPTRTLGGLRVVIATRQEFAESMIADWKSTADASGPTAPLISFSANGELISRNAGEPELARLLAQADTIDADGQPMVMYSRIGPGRALPERIATTDFFHDAARAAERHGVSFYLLGASEEIIQRTVDHVKEMYPALKIAGFRNGYFGDDDFDAVIADIRTAAPDILWVGMGTPRQHEFAIRARPLLDDVTWIKTCGGLFDFISGQNSRAPKWMQSAGLEWLYRLALEPRRLFGRYLTTNFRAAFLLLTRSGSD